jgi:2-polyprenyl-6-methoxyphenol hydroxylase-like FAD-dependent oxidoreductase
VAPLTAMNTEKVNDVIDAQVVISGGGPTGLLLASELALAGVRPIVLDTLPGPNTEPRANGVGGAAVRFLDHRGFYEQLTGSPDQPHPSPWGMFSGIIFDLSAAPSSTHTHTLRVQQPRLTHTLARHAADIGVDLRWGHRLHGFTQDAHSITVEVDGPDGRYHIQARYLVGADGGRSTTRKLAGIAFPGMSSNDAVFRIGRELIPPPEWVDRATGELDIPGYGRIPALPFLRTEVGVFMHAQVADFSLLGTLELAPSPDNVRTDSEHPGYGDPLTLAELEDSIGHVLGVHLPLVKVQPDSQPILRRFAGINSRIAGRFRRGRVLLAGDAAHVHSPLGGPGLNLCLQDAANLGWKLANVIHGRIDPALLDTYDAERRLAAENVITHSRAQLALMRPGSEITALRDGLGELISRPSVAEYLAVTLSGAAVRYPTEPDDHPAVGYWVPDITIDSPTHGVRRIAQLTRDGRPLVLDFTAHSALAHSLTNSSPALNVVAGTPTEPVDLTAVLIRPDGYVAWASSQATPAIEALNRKLAHWFGPISAAR